MPPRLRKILIQVAGFVLAAVFLYLALRGVDLGEILHAFRTADYRWLIPVVAVLLGSHVLRAWRWQILLRALPEDELAGSQPRVRPAFSSLMIGYMINYAAPRLGEVARSANMATRSRLSFSSVLGTVAAERLIDVVMLAIALISVVFLLSDRLGMLEQLFVQPFQDVNLILVGAIVLLIGVLTVLGFFGLRRLVRSESVPFITRWSRRAKSVVDSFMDGFRTLARAPQRGLVAGISVGMWLLYAVAAYIPFQMLHLAQPFDISIGDAWSIMVLGSLGVVVPSPGGAGSYHYITVETLVHLFDVTRSPAASYAFLTHAAQMVLYIIVGVICLLLQTSRPSDLLRPADEHPATATQAD